MEPEWPHADNLGDHPMAAKRVSKQAGETSRIVDFDLNQRTYQIDPERKKVYRRFVEIETSRASEIISLWRARLASA